MKIFAATLAASLTLIAGHHDPVPQAADVKARAASAAHCNEHVAKRYEGMRKRGSMSLFEKAPTTHFDKIQNTTCVLAPTVTEGPYWITGEQVRNDITEDQQGKPLVLDIGILDVNTCEPLEGAYIDVWHANATGYYSGFEDFTLDAPSKRQMNTPTSNNTYLRGIAKTNEEGIVEFKTIFGGFYTGRAPHFHLKAFIDAEESDDGSITGGETAFTGQLFFTDETANDVFAEYPYTENENTRSYNSDDTILTSEQGNGNNPIVDLVDIDGTFYGIITVGINATATDQTG
ncbi:aromatic compound dioxygenase [Wallemia mellicola]|uniref:Aromatic compound dioxygenase n=1 Tax=Wallemia mellicola TaxID=1708541 RepID=A0A4T0MW06_9BASI|nr:aromatic compound dioxygenase [Wallemia mellicola]TIB88044.1 aromatic compound dioxygenase [Wallemia mellicola]TIB90806.1 aromatic compound dioxygenase [Wallemia mellicola]TIC42644.1 aromatic compound dioxygenase [Wallemia mellicola]TIC51373.1 aromatic compound dioxygenase [Wallemia mellicola]